MTRERLMDWIVFCGALLVLALAVENSRADYGLDPYTDYRCCEVPIKVDANGSPTRSSKVIAAFRKQNPCPSTGLTTGACPGWAINHVVPRDCGGFDAVYNLMWMSNLIKVSANIGQDRYERKIHGTGNCTAVPPGGILYPAKHGVLNY